MTTEEKIQEVIDNVPSYLKPEDWYKEVCKGIGKFCPQSGATLKFKPTYPHKKLNQTTNPA